MSIEATLERIATALEKIAVASTNAVPAPSITPPPVSNECVAAGCEPFTTGQLAIQPQRRGRQPVATDTPASDPTPEPIQAPLITEPEALTISDAELEEGIEVGAEDLLPASEAPPAIPPAPPLVKGEHVKAIVVQVRDRISRERAISLLKEVGGAESLASLPENRYRAVYDACAKVLARLPSA